MNLLQQFVMTTARRYGHEPIAWPLWRRLLFTFLIRVNRSCRQVWQSLERRADPEDLVLLQRYSESVPELGVSDAMLHRLQAITELPQHSVGTAPVPRVMGRGAPFWQISFASAMASALLGVVLGAGGYLGELNDGELEYRDAALVYEVSDWLAGDVQ